MAHILIADDERPQRLIIREMLSTDPTFTFTETSDGFETLETARQERPDVIILDILMPRIDGLNICRLLKADPDLCHTIIIVVTALDPIVEEDRLWIAGADGFLRKPLEEGTLCEMVHQGLGHAQALTTS